ncbi:MAG: alpha/beta fold hydrolase [Gammaproteobacteria bacterium]|nr:alpha/beta fold hydrolase [Gammaproteobacteria bacterium]
MSRILETVEVETAANPTHSVIWLHGLGADGHDFEAIVPELDLDAGRGIRFVFPHAPVRPVTLNGGVPMRAWYDIISLDRHGRADEQGLRESQQQVEALIAREVERGSPVGSIVIAGFSQGGALALQTGLRHADKLAGIMALSCYLPLQNSFTDELSVANRETPVFMAHGIMDPVVALQMGSESRDFLEQQKIRVEWHQYPMAHAVCNEELRDISLWLRTVLGV